MILALPPSARQRVDYYLAKLRALPVQVTIVQDVEEIGTEDGKVRWVAGERLVVLMDRPISRLGIAIKRAMDVAIASVALLVAAPFLLVAAIAISLESKGGVVFRQERIGFNNRPFTVLKLRTMSADAAGQDGSAQAVRGDARVTRVGAFLRRTSIDELPQLLNVLDGSMSLIGPRPQAVNMRIGDRRYSEAVAEYVVRHKVRPGLTGWAQINGTRAGIYTLEQAARAVDLDLHYVQNWSAPSAWSLPAGTPSDAGGAARRLQLAATEPGGGPVRPAPGAAPDGGQRPYAARPGCRGVLSPARAAAGAWPADPARAGGHPAGGDQLRGRGAAAGADRPRLHG